MPSNDNKNLADIVRELYYPKYMEGKRFLLCHYLLFSENKSVESITSQYPEDIVKYIEILDSDDSCSFCQKRAGKNID